MAERMYSIVEFYSEREGHKCGYCNGVNTNFTHGMWAHHLTVQDYQSLIDRGWRRSGCYCYKPIMDQICCPMYTIRCEALSFVLSKSQKKILKRMAKFLRNELKKEDMDTSEGSYDYIDINGQQIPNYNIHRLRAEKNVSKINISSIDSEINGRLHPKGTLNADKQKNMKMSPDSLEKSSISNEKDSLHTSIKEEHMVQDAKTDSERQPCRKAKFLRIERKRNKLLAQGKTSAEIETIFKERKQQNCAKSLEEMLEEVLNETNRLQLKLVRTSPVSIGYQNTSQQSYQLYKKYQSGVHGVPAEEIDEDQYTRFLVKSPLEMKLVRVLSDEFNNTLDTSANLFKKYQMAIHGETPEECDKDSFLDFLVKSPLQEWTPNGGPPHGYGSFHEQYWLDNELIAVGVIDILPACISSVYFFYDPEYSHLSLGTLSSLRETYLTRQYNKYARDLKYYYMGFYIHSCPKMRYKAKIKPSKLLCPETYVWCNLEPSLVKLNERKYCRLNEDLNAVDWDSIVDINKVLILYAEVAVTYMIFKVRVDREITEEEEEDIKRYASQVGTQCTLSILLYRK